MIPIIALVGRCNVGKSTLFNRLTRSRDSLVMDFPGLTRDRKYGCAEWKNNKFTVIDTSGIEISKIGIEAHMVRQSLVAIEEADIVFFVVDGQSGLMSADQYIIRHLRLRQKMTVIVVNKIDGINNNTVSTVSDFYSFGIDNVCPISALYGRGINILLKRVLLPLFNNNLLKNNFNHFNLYSDNKIKSLIKKKENENIQSLPIKLAIVGRPNVGKSKLINCILGEERVVVYDIPGTTRDSIHIPMIRNNYKYILIDTAGVRKNSKITQNVEKFSIIKTLQAIEVANIVLLVIDSCTGFSSQDFYLLDFILKSGRSIVIVVNKWDILSSKMQCEVKEKLKSRLICFNFIRVHFISALYNIGINYLFESIHEAYKCTTKRVKTAFLTRIMHAAIEKHQPPLVHGRRIKPKYVHVGGYNPLILVIHGTQVKDLPNTYKRYLINFFRDELEMIGMSIFIQFNETINPFIDQYHEKFISKKICQYK